MSRNDTNKLFITFSRYIAEYGATTMDEITVDFLQEKKRELSLNQYFINYSILRVYDKQPYLSSIKLILNFSLDLFTISGKK